MEQAFLMAGIYTKHITENTVPGMRLGRHVAHDPRSKQFVAEQADTVTDVWHGAHGLPLNQTRGSCTAEALSGALNTAPNYSAAQALLTQTDADRLYDEEIVLEGGNPATDDPGGTGLWICQVAQKDGLITRYDHAFGIDQALKALTLRPVITGVDWYEGFDRPDAHGFVKIAGEIRGGHEFVAVGISTSRQAVACWNSWSPDWGPWGGRFWMRWADWEQLLAAQGDVTVPIK